MTDVGGSASVRDDVTDGVAIRRRDGDVAVGAVGRRRRRRCSSASSSLVRAPRRRPLDRARSSPRSSSPLLAAAAVVVTWLESRRITRHLNRTIERLIDTESELRLLLDDLPEAVVSLDDDGVVRGANAKAAELTGRPVGELVGRPFAELVERAARHRPRRRGWPSGRAGRPAAPVDVPPAARRRRATTLVEATVDRPRQTDGGVIVRLRDVTEREERVRALEQARRRFQQAFHSAPTGMALVRLDDSTILDANRSLADMLGRPRRRARRAQHPRDHPPRRPAGGGRRTGPGSSSASPTRTCSTSATCAATASSCGPARGSRSPRTTACRWRSPTSRTSPSSAARPSGCSGRRPTTTSPGCRTAPS